MAGDERVRAASSAGLRFRRAVIAAGDAAAYERLYRGRVARRFGYRTDHRRDRLVEHVRPARALPRVVRAGRGRGRRRRVGGRQRVRRRLARHGPERFPWVNLIASEENLGFGRAVNRVAERTDSEWIAPANTDIAVQPGRARATARGGSPGPGAGAVAPRLVLPDGAPRTRSAPSRRSRFTAPALGRRVRIPVAPDRPLRLSRALGHGALAPCRHGPSPRSSSCGAAAWDEIGGFDERQWMYAEDLDLGWRLHQAGWATRYEPDAVVDHEVARGRHVTAVRRRARAGLAAGDLRLHRPAPRLALRARDRVDQRVRRGAALSRGGLALTQARGPR